MENNGNALSSRKMPEPWRRFLINEAADSLFAIHTITVVPETEERNKMVKTRREWENALAVLDRAGLKQLVTNENISLPGTMADYPDEQSLREAIWQGLLAQGKVAPDPPRPPDPEARTKFVTGVAVGASAALLFAFLVWLQIPSANKIAKEVMKEMAGLLVEQLKTNDNSVLTISVNSGLRDVVQQAVREELAAQQAKADSMVAPPENPPPPAADDGPQPDIPQDLWK